MKALRLVLSLLVALLISASLRAEDKPTAPTPFKENGELPKAPEGTPGLAAAHQNESLVGNLAKGALPNKAALKNMSKADRKAAKGGVPDPTALTLHIAGMKVKGDKESKKDRTLKITASGEMLNQLNALAEKGAHVKVTGDVAGDTMTVKEVSEAPAQAGAKPAKKKKKDNV